MLLQIAQTSLKDALKNVQRVIFAARVYFLMFITKSFLLFLMETQNVLRKGKLSFFNVYARFFPNGECRSPTAAKKISYFTHQYNPPPQFR